MPSKRAVARVREEVRRLTASRRYHVPVAVVVADLNALLRGWQQYFQFGHARRAQHRLSAFAIDRLMRHLRRRSQRPVRPPDGMTWYGYLTQSLGLHVIPPRRSAIGFR